MTRSRDTVGVPVIALQAGRFGVRIPADVKRFSLFQIVQYGSDAPPTSYSMATGIS